jgi:hypothetical protein
LSQSSSHHPPSAAQNQGDDDKDNDDSEKPSAIDTRKESEKKQGDVEAPDVAGMFQKDNDDSEKPSAIETRKESEKEKIDKVWRSMDECYHYFRKDDDDTNEEDDGTNDRPTNLLEFVNRFKQLFQNECVTQYNEDDGLVAKDIPSMKICPSAVKMLRDSISSTGLLTTIGELKNVTTSPRIAATKTVWQITLQITKTVLQATEMKYLNRKYLNSSPSLIRAGGAPQKWTFFLEAR